MKTLHKPHFWLIAAFPIWFSVASYGEGQNETFKTTVKASSEHALGQTACDLAFDQARSEALLQFDESEQADDPLLQLQLTEQQESRRQREESKTICEVTTTWHAVATMDANNLIGTEQSVSGIYKGQCLDQERQNICWNRVTEQAKRDLLLNLSENYINTRDIDAIYTDFEGRQRDQYLDGRYTSTADGRFYFDIVAFNNVSKIKVERKDARTPSKSPVVKTEPVVEKKDKGPDFDISLSYTWDGNDDALSNSTAISSERFGIGVWSNNRLGFVAFSGTDTVGIGKSNNVVKNSSASYDTTGIGMGVRLWRNRSITLENLVYYVDAQPFEADITNLCSGCTDRTFESEDYVQTTLNLKTNSKGVNIGWMLTWKWLDKTANVDKLSGGWYVEVLF